MLRQVVVYAVVFLVLRLFVSNCIFEFSHPEGFSFAARGLAGSTKAGRRRIFSWEWRGPQGAFQGDQGLRFTLRC